MDSKLTITTIFTVLAAVTGLSLAPTAAADPQDGVFVQQLNQAGIKITDPPSLVGNTGRTICQLLEADWTVGTASYSVKSEYPQLSDGQARQFVIVSHNFYCPDA